LAALSLFFYKLTVRSKRGNTRSSTNTFHECLKPEYIGGIAAAALGKPSTTSISVTKISQRAYQKATA
jgi:hypothetical protein